MSNYMFGNAASSPSKSQQGKPTSGTKRMLRDNLLSPASAFDGAAGIDVLSSFHHLGHPRCGSL